MPLCFMCLAPSFLPSRGGAVTRIPESKRRRAVTAGWKELKSKTRLVGRYTIWALGIGHRDMRVRIDSGHRPKFLQETISLYI